MLKRAQASSVNILDLIARPRESCEADMRTRFRDLAVKDYWNLIWPFVTLVAIGLTCRTVSQWYPQDVLEAFADALMVAGALGIVFELFATRFLIERVADDLSDKLVGRGLPPELQAHIRAIVDTDFVRDHYIKTYSIATSSQPDTLTLDVRVSFDVKNYSDSTKGYIPILQEETFYSPEFVDVEYGVIGGEYQTLSAAKLAQLTETDPKTNVKTIRGPAIKLEPFRRNDRAVCTVRISYRLRMPLEYSDITNFDGATIGATIRIEKIPDTLEFVSTGDHTIDSKSWYFPEPFIAGQHVRVWWFRKK
jgi:hypothetical protein